MKNLRRFCATAVLTLTLALSVFAGEIGCPGRTDPEPQTTAMCATESPEAMIMVDTSDPGMTSLDPVTEASLHLLKSLLSLF